MSFRRIPLRFCVGRKDELADTKSAERIAVPTLVLSGGLLGRKYQNLNTVPTITQSATVEDNGFSGVDAEAAGIFLRCFQSEP